ncbi:MAG TPA: hypothetical protein VLD19_06990 [Chitinophagaceae bacterium]|nr:hypothetical protein [Chitinophagaceae bacterium]
MKHIFSRQLPVWIILCTTLSCAKQNTGDPTASLTIFNAVPGTASSLVTNFTSGGQIVWYKTALKLAYGTQDKVNQPFSFTSGQQLTIYNSPDTLAQSAPLFKLALNFQPGTIHTLFLTGTLTAPDTLLTADVPPYHPSTDSSVGVRMVNLSPGNAPISVNFTGLANGSEVSSLSYKGITAFKMYPATSAVAHYNFEFRDAASGALLGSYDLTGINTTGTNTRRFRNITLVFMGLPTDPTPRKIAPIEAY